MPGTESIVVLVDHQLRRAIGERRLIEFTYQHMWRVAEPHDYGIRGWRMVFARVD